MRLENRIAVVTGGGSGIGAAICQAFAQEGARVAVTDSRRQAAEDVAAGIRQAGGQAEAWAMDVADRASVESAASDIAVTLADRGTDGTPMTSRPKRSVSLAVVNRTRPNRSWLSPGGGSNMEQAIQARPL